MSASSSESITNADTISAGFTGARRTARVLREFPGSPPDTLTAAYQVQDVAIDIWGEPVAGWKVARIAPQLATQFPEPRLIGPAFARNVHFASDRQPVPCPVFDGGFAAVETEIIILVAHDAPADKMQWSVAEACALVGDMRIGIEVASSPLATLNDLGPGAVISDFGNNWGIVVGRETISDWRTRTAPIECETFIDNVSVGKRGVSIEEGPLKALAFTLGKAAARGRPLRRGAVITTGMITGVHDIRIGQTSRHVFDGYGEVRCRIMRAEALQD